MSAIRERDALALDRPSPSFRGSRSENPESIEPQVTCRIGFRVRAKGARPGMTEHVASLTMTDDRYRFALTCSAELCAASASLAEIAAVSAAVPQLGASLPLPQARGR